MSLLESALSLASQGFHVFPLVPNGKKPLIEDFPTLATRDPERIKDWWIDPIMEFERDYNVGISTSRFGDDGALLVIDVDNKDGKNGTEELMKLDLLHEVPETFSQTTPTGGEHLFYKVKEPVKQGTNVLGLGLDIRSKGGFVVGAGSLIDGKPYKVNWKIDLLEDAPQWIVEKCGKPHERSKVEVDLSNINEEAATNRAIHYLTNEAPISIEGQGGDQIAYKVAARVKDLGVDEVSAAFLMDNYWNDRCSPPWEFEELEKKVSNAYHYGNEPVGASAPEAQFERITVEPSQESLSYLQQMNQEYALVYMGGQHFILHETIDEKGRPARSFLSEQTFKRKFSPYSVQKKSTYAQEWLDWKHRREFKGVCFAPEREARHGYYNLWRGFTVTPLKYSDGTAEQKSGFDAFLEHTKNNICRGDEKLFTWLVGYFAHMVQRPFERPLTTLVFRGGKGVGKNAFVDRIGAILGSGHYLVAHDGRYLTSNFNAHFDSCLCLVLDEAFWSGDKSAEGKLKGITTAPEIMIERKGKEPYMVDNLVRLIVIGNENWLVPASADERRYAVYDVGNGRKQDRKFFTEMRIAMDEKGGNRILLDYLKNFDLSKVDINAAPKTQALLDQKVSSLEPFEMWWLNCLVSGRIIGSDFGNEWETDLDKDRFRNAFIRYCRESQIRSRLPDERTLGKMLKSVLPSVDASKKKRDGDILVNIYRVPKLDEARKEWDSYIGQATAWDQ